MRISVADAEGQLSDLIRLAENGVEILLVQDSLIVAQLQSPPMIKPLSPEQKSKIFDEIHARVQLKKQQGLRLHAVAI